MLNSDLKKRRCLIVKKLYNLYLYEIISLNIVDIIFLKYNLSIKYRLTLFDYELLKERSN